MIGKTVGSMRRTVDAVPGGNCVTIWLMAALTCKVAAIMSVPHSKVAEISAAPRLVAERTSVSRGIPRRACSTGVVTWSTICWAGRSPASSEILTRGNWMLGNNATGNDNAAPIPANTGNNSRKSSERLCRPIHSVSVDEFISVRPRGPPCHPATRNCRP